MPRIGLSITKSCAFRDSTQEFSNVYYFEMLSEPSQAAGDTIIDNMVAKEKTFHSALVTFVRAKLWSAGGGAAANQMISQKNVSGVGARPGDSGTDKERAYLFRLRAGVDSRGNPVYLRKWYHACGAFVASNVPSGPILANATGYTQAERDAQVAAMSGIGDAAGSSGAPKLCSKNGRLPDAGANWSAHKYLEHHQLGDQWRGT